MRPIIVLILTCLSVFAADTNDIHVVSWSYKNLPEDSLATIEVFTRSGETNLIRHTNTKDGVVLFRSHSFYHKGIEAGVFTYQIANGTNTGVGASAGSPYFFNVNFDASNRPKSVHISATNLVKLDWFVCTNGMFYPADKSWIEEANTRLPKLPTK
jgi:hypothetical protein